MQSCGISRQGLLKNYYKEKSSVKHFHNVLCSSEAKGMNMIMIEENRRKNLFEEMCNFFDQNGGN